MHTFTRRGVIGTAGALTVLAAVGAPAATAATRSSMQTWAIKAPRRSGIHDVAPAPDGGVWFTAQESGQLGWFDPKRGTFEFVALAQRSSPHGVIAGPDKAAWITDGAQNALVRVGWPDRKVLPYTLPANLPNVNLNTAVFDKDGDLWFTGQFGYTGKVSLKTGQVHTSLAPRGRGPYGMCVTPAGDVWWCSLAGSYIARIDRGTGASTIVEPPAPGAGTRRLWSDSRNRLWVTEWTAGQLALYDPAAKAWKEWRLPGQSPQPYAVYVDERDIVWVSDFAANAILAFDPKTEKFETHALPRPGAGVRQLAGRPGELWFGESGTDHIGVIRTA
jgi:virginiamycin B lyase